jgi:cytochrome c553
LLLALSLTLTACKPQPPATAPPPAPSPSAVASPARPVRTAADIFHACQLCHSTREAQRGPILDGLPAWSVELQLRKFRDGLRGRNEANKSELLMGAGESILHDDDEIHRVAAHIAALPPQKHLLTVRGNAERGRTLYATHCAACHGERGEGKPEIKSPPLNTLEDWFHLDQLRKFQQGLRGTDPRDVEGRIMRAAMTAVKEDDLRDIVRHVSETLGGHQSARP